MKHSLTLLLLCFVFISLGISLEEAKPTPKPFQTPLGWPKPTYNFNNNPLTEEAVQLGRVLFYDPILSKDNTISCASCHLQATGFTHVDHELSHGIEGRIGTRNSMTLMNLAWATSFMWDGAINHLDVQALAPITHPDEMHENLAHVIAKLNRNNRYKILFAKANPNSSITGEHTLKAISQFLLTLTTSNSKYDSVQNKQAKFTEMESKGYQVFKIHCASCHTEPLFTNGNFENNGLLPDTTLNDWGRYKVTRKPADSLKFKVPTLRNIQFTYPYMHDGRFKTLSEVVKHYNSGISNSRTLAKQLQQPLKLTDNNRVEIIAFLKTLTDTTFLFNKNHNYPKE